MDQQALKKIKIKISGLLFLVILISIGFYMLFFYTDVLPNNIYKYIVIVTIHSQALIVLGLMGVLIADGTIHKLRKIKF